MTRVCKCHASCSVVGDFKQVVDLKNSGLHIYVPINQESTKLKSTNKKIKDLFVLHNAGVKKLTRPQYIKELCQYRTNCLQCTAIIKRVHSLLDEITDIQLDGVLSVCQYCKAHNSAGRCKRCEYFAHKFECAKANELEDNKDKHNKDQHERFVSWLLKANELLHAIVQNKDEFTSTLHKQPSSSLNEYDERLLQALRTPVDVCRPFANYFEKFDPPDVKRGVFPYKIGGSGIVSEQISAFVNYDNFKLLEELDDNKGKTSLHRPDKKSATAHEQKDVSTKKQTGKLLPKLQKSRNEKEPLGKSDKTRAKHKRDVNITENNAKTPEKTTQHDKNIKSKKISHKTPDAVLIKTNKDKRAHTALKSKKKVPKNITEKKTKSRARNKSSVNKIKFDVGSLLHIGDGQGLNVNVTERLRKTVGIHVDETLSSIKMIKGTSVVPFAYRDDKQPAEAALLYNVKHDVLEDLDPPLILPSVHDRSSSGVVDATSSHEVGKKKSSLRKPDEIDATTETTPRKRFVYQLSNRDFIKNGWTILPTKKILRVINIYKMEPALPQYDWFEHNKEKKIMFYDTGEKLAEIDEDGHGRWFYKNGEVALDFHSTAKESHGGQRFVVYSRGDHVDVGSRKCSPKTVLASFDYRGNGIVYDMYGNVRLKYNQFEGVLHDEKVGPSTHWKWNSLNEPLELVEVLEDKYCKSLDPRVMKNIKNLPPDHHTPRQDDPEILAIEYENHVKAHKAMTENIFQNFKTFKIRMKALKLNDNFSLRVCDQANIYLRFRDAPISLKLNVGMNLTNELIDIKKVDMSDVMTNYDHLPPLSPSIEDIQKRVERAKRHAKIRVERTDRLVMPFVDSEVKNVHNDDDNDSLTYCHNLLRK